MMWKPLLRYFTKVWKIFPLLGRMASFLEFGQRFGPACIKPSRRLCLGAGIFEYFLARILRTWRFFSLLEDV